MFRFDPQLTVWLHRDAVDFRMNINGLAALVKQSLQLDPLAGGVSVFTDRRRDRIKLLRWDWNGPCRYQSKQLYAVAPIRSILQSFLTMAARTTVKGIRRSTRLPALPVQHQWARYKHPSQAAVARVVRYANQPKLVFNYRTVFDEIWDNVLLQKSRPFSLLYRDETGVTINLND